MTQKEHPQASDDIADTPAQSHIEQDALQNEALQSDIEDFATHSEVEPAQSTRPPSVVKILLSSMVFSLLIVCVAIFYLKRAGEQQQAQQSQQLADLQQALSDAQQDYQALQSSVTEAQQQAQAGLQSQAAQLQNKIDTALIDFNNTLEKQRLQLQVLAQPRIHDWPLQEAVQLLKQADRALQIGHDIASAIAILQDVDRVLREMPDTRIQYLQQAVKEQLAQLRGFSTVDQADLALSIAALYPQVGQLTFNMVQLPDAVANAELEASPDFLQRFWQGVKEDWIVVQRRSQPVQPLLSSDQQFLVKQNILLALQQAQWAVLHEENALYHTMLVQVVDWLRQFYRLDEPRADAFAAEIQRLLNIDLVVKYPNLAETIQLFDAELKSRLQSHKTPSE